MDSEIGNLRVRLSTDTSGLDAGVQHGERRLKQFGSSMERTTAIARRLTGVLGAVGIGVGFAQAIREVSNFQAAMNGLAAVSGATADQMATLEQQARSLGATSQFSAQQAGEAQRFLAQAGFEVNEILGATPGILQLATAGSLDLASAADIASNVLGGMRMEVDELNRVNDVLAATAARSNTSIEQLGQALSYAAPFAAGAGIEIEDLAAAIGVMSDAGIQGSRAGTGMIGVIRQLSNVTSAGEAVLDRYGLSLEDVDISARGLEPVLNTLREANLTTADSIQLFGSEAGAAAQVLVSDYKGGIEDATGEAERMAKQLDQGLGPAFKSLQSAMSESVLQMGDSGLAGALENLIRTTTGVVSVWNGMTDQWAEANNVGDGTVKMVRTLGTVTEALAVMVAARLTTAVLRYGAAQVAANAAMLRGAGAARALHGALALVGGPLGLLVGAAGLLYAFREELGLVGQEAHTTAQRIQQLTQSIATMSATDLTRNLEAARMEMRFLSDQGQNLRNVLRNMGPGDTWDGRTYEELRQQMNRIRGDAGVARDTVRELESALDRVMNPGTPNIPELPGITPGTRGGAGDDSAAKRQEEERERLREHLARRLEMIRESLMDEGELETNRYLEKMEQLHEAREMELLGEEEHRQLMRDIAEQHHAKLNDIEARAADERKRIQQEEARQRQAVVDGMMNNLVSLMNSGSKEMFRIGKIAAVAQALLAGREAIVNSYNAGTRIGGPPLGAAFAADRKSVV